MHHEGKAYLGKSGTLQGWVSIHLPWEEGDRASKYIQIEE